MVESVYRRAEHFKALRGCEHRLFAAIDHGAYVNLIEQGGGAPNDVHMSQRDRIKAAGIHRDIHKTSSSPPAR